MCTSHLSETLVFMGEVMTVRAIVWSGYPDDLVFDGRSGHKRVIIRRDYYRRPGDLPRAGWLVGCRYLKSGTWQRPIYDDKERPAYFDVDSTTPVYVVCFWPNMLPVYALPSDCVFDDLRPHR